MITGGLDLSKIKPDNLPTQEKQDLYAVALKKWVGGRKTGKAVLEIRYRHAIDAQNAKKDYIASICDWHGNPREMVEIIGVSKVIGYIALDDNGDKLTV